MLNLWSLSFVTLFLGVLTMDMPFWFINQPATVRQVYAKYAAEIRLW
ncbi:hypothetical protein NBRC116597_18860 [Phaeobacter sp. NW0010-22]